MLTTCAVFRSRLNTHLFNISHIFLLWLYSAHTVKLSCLGHYNRSSFLTYFTVSNGLSADLVQGYSHGLSETGRLEKMLFWSCRWRLPVCIWCVGDLETNVAADVIWYWLSVHTSSFPFYFKKFYPHPVDRGDILNYFSDMITTVFQPGFQGT